MKKAEILKRIFTKPKDVYYYFQGNFRYKAYYSNRWNFLLSSWMQNQIKFRISVMDRDCYNEGSCKLCGCETTALQMSDKPCDKPCYPRMMKFTEYYLFRYKGRMFADENGYWCYDLKTGELKLTKR